MTVVQSEKFDTDQSRQKHVFQNYFIAFALHVGPILNVDEQLQHFFTLFVHVQKRSVQHNRRKVKTKIEVLFFLKKMYSIKCDKYRLMDD